MVDGVKCGPDGVRCDVEGNLWVSSNAGRAVGYSGVTVWTPEGKLIGRIRLPEVCGNICVGGPKRNRLFMAASQSCTRSTPPRRAPRPVKPSSDYASRPATTRTPLAVRQSWRETAISAPSRLGPEHRADHARMAAAAAEVAGERLADLGLARRLERAGRASIEQYRAGSALREAAAEMRRSAGDRSGGHREVSRFASARQAFRRKSKSQPCSAWST
jgi:hypothetical protein